MYGCYLEKGGGSVLGYGNAVRAVMGMLMLLKKVSVLGNGNHASVFWIMGPLSLINLPCTGVKKHEIVYVLSRVQLEPAIFFPLKSRV